MFQWREWRFLIIGEAFLTHKKIFYLLNVCKSLNLSKKMVARKGIEPPTNCLEGSCSIH